MNALVDILVAVHIVENEFATFLGKDHSGPRARAYLRRFNNRMIPLMVSTIFARSWHGSVVLDAGIKAMIMPNRTIKPKQPPQPYLALVAFFAFSSALILSCASCLAFSSWKTRSRSSSVNSIFMLRPAPAMGNGFPQRAHAAAPRPTVCTPQNEQVVKTL